MRARKSIHFLIDLFLMFGTVLLMINVWIFFKDYKNTTTVRLEHPIPYNSEMNGILKQMKEENLPCSFWSENHDVTVYNKDFMRSEKVDTIGFAGDSGNLFPNSNSLAAGEEGFCILGSDTANKLFGSMHVIGRTIEIDGNSYAIAGVEFTKKNLCMYELNQVDNTDMQYAVFHYENRASKQITIRRLENLCGITVKPYITEHMQDVIRPKLIKFVLSFVLLLITGVDLIRFLRKK